MATSVSTASVRSADTAHATDWRMWVPCVGMALCSLLSFIDRQVLAVLSPTILRDTGLTPADFGNVVFFFFIAYTVSNPLWGSIIDRIGVRLGMILAVAIWSAASGAHAFMSSAFGFGMARLVLGLGEGGTFPGSLRTAMDSLPAHLRGRGTATAFSGGTIGAIVTPLFFVPFALAYGWRAAFILSAIIGVAWILLWAIIARPPFLKASQAPSKIGWPNLFERRIWALAFSYGPTAISSGPIQAFGALYLARKLHVSQAEIGRIFWIPMFTWALGYYAGGWAADRYCSDNPRPIGLFWLCTLLALPFGFTAQTESVTIAVASISFSTFMAGVFQMLALKVGTHSFPREKTAMMSGIATASWSLLNAGLAPQIGKLFNQNRYDEAFWMVALLPVIGTIGWWLLSGRANSAQSLSTAPATS